MISALSVRKAETLSDAERVQTPFIDRDGPYSIWHLKGASVIGGKSGVAGIFRGDKFLATQESINKERPQFILDDCHVAAGLYNHSSQAEVDLDGEWAFLNDSHCQNFWHWICECLPKILMMTNMGYQGGFIVPKGKFIEDSLNILGVNFVHMTSPRTNVEILILFDPFDACGGRQTLAKNPTLVYDIRYAMMRELSCQEFSGGLYVSRKTTRKVLNEDAVLGLLEARGAFDRRCTEDYPFATQIAMAADASVLVGPHGAGHALSMFMPEGSTVIELFSPLCVRPCMIDIHRILGHRWIPLTSTNNPSDGPYHFGENIMVDLNALDQVLSTNLAP